MTIRNATLGASLLALCASAFAGGTYKVREGDTLSEIAGKLGVTQRQLAEANGLGNRHKLKVGSTLRVPRTSRSSSSQSPTVRRSYGSHVVRNGDTDWTIARRHGISVAKLHAANPGTRWTALQIGSSIRIPGATSAARPSVAANTSRPVRAGGKYVVRNGDNDWIIARRHGISPTVLRKLNPGVRWQSLQIGQALRVPGSNAGTAVASTSPVIRSRHAVVAKDAVVLRRGPSTSAAKVTTVDRGTRVTVLDREGSWYKLRFPMGTVAWVRGDNLKTATPVVAQATTRTRETLRAQRRTTSSSASQRVASRTGKKSATRVASNLPSTGYALLDEARRWKGTPYRYGAMSRGAVDCSGFVGQVFRKKGIRLPRTSAEQSRVGQAVSRGSLKPGDLVFFRTRSSRRINHVGIYMGDGRFIHASSGGGKVQVNSLSEGYYQRRFATARRVANVKRTAPKAEEPRVAKVEEAPVAAPVQETVAPETPGTATTTAGGN